MPPTPTVIVWDIGNVLVEWDPERYYDARIGPEDRARLFAEVDLDGANLSVDAGAPFRETFHALADAHPRWSDQIRWWHDDWATIFGPPIDRSVRLLRTLHAKGATQHALTNFGADSFAQALRMHDFLHLFDAAHVSAHLRAVKPHPPIYEVLEAATGAPAEAHLFVDDRADNVAAARARGWRAHRFDGPDGWADRLVSEGLLTQDEAR